MKMAVIGAGIYGCHLALELNKCGHEIDLYDMSNDLFTGASANNSFRIHKGYHYPRSAKTREMCMLDEKEFTKCYPHLISIAKNNPKIFCVANDEKTLVDFSTMKIIMRGSGLPFEELTLDQLSNMGFANIEGGFRVYESVFLVDKAKKWFKRTLEENGVKLKLNNYIGKIESVSKTQILIGEKIYDYVINCTYNQALQYNSKKHRHYFDLCFYLVVASKRPKKDCSITSFGIFDGSYPSLEPYGYAQIPAEYKEYANRKIFQIFHVKYTSINQYINVEAARKAKKVGLSEQQVNELTEKILRDTSKFYPAFNDEFEVIDYRLALKTKVADLNDARPLMVLADQEKHPRLIQVFSSKLTSIFGAGKLVKLLVKAKPDNYDLLAA